ncbi:acyl-homoserine-lactone synthase [Chromobacterium sp. Beijing]|uniref:acyl-homoserine-lactone synthase n=1 Tax=Chromobacterium sp. Beijing TaxID=2735795 RepID=UPI001F16D28E|nr:acyl-homoserine-lactone synthase [Chromobacterium sp. Beijing]UJB32295.1 GNAT family N-acetyltransferase [Chromobacterium sp. Beijing]
MARFFPIKLGNTLISRVNGMDRETDLLKFRHHVFREQLHWVAPSADGLDRDEYDDFSDNLAVQDMHGVLGSVRLTHGTHPFMIEREFSRLLASGEKILKGARTAEITRFAVDKRISPQQMKEVGRLLYLSLLEWSLPRGIERMYFVVEPVFYRHIVRMGFPVVPVGVPMHLDGGVLSMAGYVDWSQAEPEFILGLRKGIEAPRELARAWREFEAQHASMPHLI